MLTVSLRTPALESSGLRGDSVSVIEIYRQEAPDPLVTASAAIQQGSRDCVAPQE
jgi:hypothetical protein